MIIDSHAHLNFKAFDDDLEDVLQRTLENNIRVVNVGSNYETSKKAVDISRPGIYAAIGLHPIHATKDPVDFEYDKYKELALSEKTVAIGETGLDYYNKPKNKKKLSEFKEGQKDIFLKHLDLADELGLPVILHCRMAHKDLIELLKTRKKKIKGVVHCFTGGLSEADEYLNLGLYIGFTGIIFKLDLRDVIKAVPSDRILAETDCPYLTPPNREGRNEPLYVKDVIGEIERIKGFEMAEKTAENAKKLFRI